MPSAGSSRRGHAGVGDLAEIVGRDVGGHAHGDARRSVDEQVGQPRGEDRRLGLGAVVVGNEVDGFLVDVGQQLVRDPGHAHLGVAHRGRGVAVDGAEVALAVDQHHPHRELLRHAHERVVHRTLAVRVVLADRVAHHPGGLLVGAVPVVAQLAHRVEHAPVDRFQAVADIRQRPADDYAHGVIEVGLLHLLFDVDRYDFLSEITHLCASDPALRESCRNLQDTRPERMNSTTRGRCAGPCRTPAVTEARPAERPRPAHP